MTWYRTLFLLVNAPIVSFHFNAPLHFTVIVHSRAASKLKLFAVDGLKGSHKLGLIILLEIHHLVRRHAHNRAARVVKAAQPLVARVVGHVEAHHVTVLGLVVGKVAFLAPPRAVAHVLHLFVAALRQTRRVAKVVLLDKDNGRLDCVVGLVVHAQVLLLDLRNRLDLFLAAAGSTDAGEVLMRGKGVVAAGRVVPALEAVGVGNIGVDGHCAGGEQAQTLAAKVGDLGALESNNRLGLRVKGAGRLAPDGDAHRVSCVVDQGKLALLVRGARLLGYNLANLASLFEDANDVDSVVLFDALQLLDGGKVEAHLGDVGLVLGLFNHRVTLKRQLVVVCQVGELLLCQVDAARRGDVVDGALLQKLIKRIALVVEASRLDLAALINQIDAEELALTRRLVPRLNLRLGCDAGLDCPLVRKGREALDGVDVVASVHGGSRGHRLLLNGRFGLFLFDAVKVVASNCSLHGFGLDGRGLANLVEDAVALNDLNIEDDENADLVRLALCERTETTYFLPLRLLGVYCLTRAMQPRTSFSSWTTWLACVASMV